jgi:superfamily II DNA/RNA helicase
MSKNFTDLGLSDSIVKTLLELKIVIPTEIQSEIIPLILENKTDIVGLAKTGTGKTAAFGLPLLQLIDSKSIDIQVVILVPTRELGQQLFNNLQEFSKNLSEVSIASICGGTPIKPQIEQLSKPTHLVVATPGRLVDLIQRKAIKLDKTQFLVLDEADEMVSILKESLDEIITEITSPIRSSTSNPKNHKTFLFSATLPGTVKQLIQNYLNKNVVQISTNMETVGNQEIEHQYIVVNPIEKLDVLMHFLTSKENQRGIIFCKTKAAVNKLAKNLAINRFSSGALHGSLSQGIRDRIMDQFRESNINILVATDLASRGIDVKELSFVINYHLPDTYENYVHRSGRTARAGEKGLALTILQPEEVSEIANFEKELGIKFQQFKKPTLESLDENNTILWAKQIFKTKPNHEISLEFKTKVKTIFHHLTKDELIDKLISNHLQQSKNEITSKKEIVAKKLKK